MRARSNSTKCPDCTAIFYEVLGLLYEFLVGYKKALLNSRRFQSCTTNL